MSDEQEVEYQTNESADLQLQLLVSIANKGMAFPITLFVSGTIISGTLVGVRRWQEGFAEAFTTGWSEEATASYREATGLNEPAPDPDKDDKQPLDTLKYVHLMEARVFAPGVKPLPENGLLWRGKLSDVNGFSYGVFRVDA